MRDSLRRVGVLLALAACAEPSPVPFAYGTDACDHCHMTIAEPVFAGQMVTVTGRIYRFDDPGCLAAFVGDGTVPSDRIHSLWVNDYLQPERMLRVEEAVFLRSERLRTPMNSRLAAVAPGAGADSLQAAWGAERLGWDQVLAQPAHGHGPP